MDRSGRAPDHQERWHQAKRLLHDDTIDTADGVAGLFLLLAQRLATISRLTVEDIETNGAAIELHFGSVPITIPEPLSALITDLVTTRRSHAVLAAGTASPWLFPEANPGGRSARTGSAPAYERSDCDPPKPAPHPCSSSPPNCPRPSWPAYSASTSTSPSNGSNTPPETGPTTKQTSAGDQNRWLPTKTCLDSASRRAQQRTSSRRRTRDTNGKISEVSVTDSLGRSNGDLFAGTAWHYARYRPGYPQAFFDDLARQFRLDGTGRLLDLGCGTGQLHSLLQGTSLKPSAWTLSPRCSPKPPDKPRQPTSRT